MRNALLLTCIAAAAADFLLVGTQRTGTTWVMSELARNPCVVTDGELMINRHGHRWNLNARRTCVSLLYGAGGAAEGRALCSRKFRDALDKRAAHAAKANRTGLATHYGFKWMQSVEKDWAWLAPLWKRRNVKLVVLRRSDHVRTVLSRVSNRQEGGKQKSGSAAHPDAATAKKLDAKAVALKTAKGELLKHLKRVEQSYRELGQFHEKLKRAGIPSLLTYYEALSSADAGPREWRRLVAYVLGDDAATCGTGTNATEQRTFKIHSRPLAAQVANYAEVASKLAGTRFAKFLDGGT